MADSREKRAAEIQNSIRQILYREWDPIGVAGEAPEDEYDSYISPVYRILAGGGSEQEVVEYLARTGEKIMGATRTPEAYYEQLRQVARKLLELDVRL
jgi:alkanesulfonate monooxygenase SsuD/methylene tetrahydromethanopterin reductase-like flavin-dependent oxidoreductase (luciferase family)